MEEQKEIREIQETIIPILNKEEKATDQEFIEILKMVVPGTHFRAGLDGALKAGKGALIAIENEKLAHIVDGGFKVNCRFTAQRLVELCKMDGAIILSKDMKRIMFANVLLTPESKIKTAETGTRHKAAERTAKQTGGFVVAISERRHEINVFFKNIKYNLKPTDEILRKAVIQIQLLEKHRDLFDRYTQRLNNTEIRNYESLNQAIQLIQKGRLIQKMTRELKKGIIELGNEGITLKTRLKEIIQGVEKETDLVIKDYTKLDLKKSLVLLETLSYDEILENDNILRALAQENLTSPASTRGWRMLSKTSLEEHEIANLLREHGSLGKILHSKADAYFSTLGEDKAKSFKTELDRLKLYS